MSARTRMAGRPLVAVMAVLSGWVAIRASVWEPPFALPTPDRLFAEESTAKPLLDAATIRRFSQAAQAGDDADPRMRASIAPPDLFAKLVSPNWSSRAPAIAIANPALAAQLARSRRSSSHQLLYAAAYSYLPPDNALPGYTAANGIAGAPGRGRNIVALGWQASAATSGPVVETAAQRTLNAPRPERWSADAWLLVREGGSKQRLASVNPAAYGGNQVGAVVRYALKPGSVLQPDVYGRASKALVSGGEAEAAGGISISLDSRFPLRIHGEVRVTDRPGATELRPAAFVVTGLPRQRIAPGIEAASYLQAGYVGGDFETAFVDGKATLEAPVIRNDSGQFTLGGGMWGGAQRDASRFDVGPTGSVVLSTGKATLSASVDYRFRVAGGASPGNGPAITIAASF